MIFDFIDTIVSATPPVLQDDSESNGFEVEEEEMEVPLHELLDDLNLVESVEILPPLLIETAVDVGLQ